MNNKNPIIFVTGIGQTWSSLRTDTDHRWNLFPNDKAVLMSRYPRGGKTRILALASRAIPTVLTGFPGVPQNRIDGVMADLFRFCRVDGFGQLPDEVDVRLYGSRSFRELAHVDFATGKYTDDESQSLLSRMYRDIPCRALAEEYGTDRMFCFNYSTFSDLYGNADRLHDMIKEVLQKVGDGDKVILIPMSMGATVVSAYLDKYYTDYGSVGENLVDKVVSIVGAWDGSDGLADMLLLNGGKDWNTRFYDTMLSKELGKNAKYIHFINKNATNKLLGQLVDGMLDAVLLRVSAFLALLPYDRYDEAAERLFSDDRMKTNPRAALVKKEAETYHAAQGNLRNRLTAIHNHCGVEFYFICGWGMPLGAGSNDFSFLGLFDSAAQSNSDGVIQVSSTAPGTDGTTLPDKVTGAWFPNHCWYFRNQPHELGSNNTALKLAIGLASGEVTEPNDSFPQCNDSRDIREAEYLLGIADTMPDNTEVRSAAEKVRAMLDRTVNNREADDALTAQLRTCIEKYN